MRDLRVKTQVLLLDIWFTLKIKRDLINHHLVRAHTLWLSSVFEEKTLAWGARRKNSRRPRKPWWLNFQVSFSYLFLLLQLIVLHNLSMICIKFESSGSLFRCACLMHMIPTNDIKARFIKNIEKMEIYET